MAEENKKKSEVGTDSNKEEITHRRNRVQRMKIAIIITIIILFAIPTILCILLGLRLIKLQRQVDNLYSTFSIESKEKDQKPNGGKYAYASTDDRSKVPTGDDNYIEESDDTMDIVTDTDIIYVFEEPDKMDTGDGGADPDKVDTGDDDADPDKVDTGDGDADPDKVDTGDGDADPDKMNTKDENEYSYTLDNINTMPNITEPGSTYNHEKETDSVNDRNPEGIYYGKKVYLTFDDGPTKYTDEILDILDEYNVKATFFVIGHEDEVNKERYKRIVNEGHILAIHSYSHRYKDIYKSIEEFDKDFTKLWKLLYDTTGYTPNLYRFPGGSLSLREGKASEYVRYLEDKGMTYYDWNVVNGDAEGKDYTEEQMIAKVLSGVAQKKTSVVLMHDGQGKHKTVTTLPNILDALISGGAEVLPMDDTVPLIQQIKATSVK